MKINKLAGLISLFLLLSLHLHGQIFDPVSWTTSIKQVDGKTYEIVFTANMEKGWSVYSEYLESEDGPIPTSIVFNEGNHFTLQGKTTEDDLNREEGFDAIFEMNVVKYHDRAVFRQRIVLHDTNTPVKGTITYMTCDDERCLPPAEVNFFVSASGQKIEEGQDEEKEEASLVPGNTEEKLYGIPLLDTSSPAGECESSYTYSRRDKSLWGIFLLGMLGGLLALLTPCVFPMIPLTVSFFTKGAEKGKGTSN
ncbi:MAG: protein-disulfide reductase DsbD family protein, partial [Cyclobacteriaceae bacterium]|nr:protein-disulfide reductase DsbD family protein [Cyclobacteriaceae bacterium]